MLGMQGSAQSTSQSDGSIMDKPPRNRACTYPMMSPPLPLKSPFPPSTLHDTHRASRT
jgi:hypothetical protein